jgi:hypothetical protein
MPQLKKVVLAIGEHLIYTDTYEEAVAQLAGGARPAVEVAQKTGAITSGTPAAPPGGGDQRLASVRQHLQRYKELAGQGRWAEAGKELDAIESELK